MERIGIIVCKFGNRFLYWKHQNQTKMNPKDFLVNSEDTGRFIVTSLKTGKRYFVEPIDNGERLDWGDINPATKKIEGDYGSKHKGAVTEKESFITTENGFENIITLPPGYSPLEYIENLEKQNT